MNGNTLELPKDRNGVQWEVGDRMLVSPDHEVMDITGWSYSVEYDQWEIEGMCDDGVYSFIAEECAHVSSLSPTRVMEILSGDVAESIFDARNGKYDEQQLRERLSLLFSDALRDIWVGLATS